VGDVVAFTHPNPVDPSVPGGLLVRRVLALEGEVMESGGGGSSGFGEGVGDGSDTDAGGEDDSFVIPKVGLYKLNSMDPELESTWFQPLYLKCYISRFQSM
jgi:hypothetical protein